MSNRFHQVLLAMLFIWVPLVFYARAADGVTLPRELVGCLVGAYFIVLVLQQGRDLLRTKLATALLLFLTWMAAVSFAVGLLRMEVLKGYVPFLLMAGTFFAVVFACSKGQSYEKFLDLTVWAGALLAAYGMWQGLGLDRANWATHFERRAFSTLGNPDFLSDYLVGLFPLAFVLMLRSKTLLAWLGLRLVLILLLSALLFAKVFGSFIALAGVLLFLLGAFLSPWGKDLFKRNMRFILTVFGIIVIGMGGYLVLKGGPAVILSKQVSIRQRTDIYQVALEMVKKNPWTGIGLGQVGIQYPLYQDKPFTAGDPAHPYTYTQHIHNEYLQFAVEGGLTGLGLFLALLLVFASSVFQFIQDGETPKQDKELMIGVSGGMVALLIQSLSNFPLRVAPSAVLFGLLLAGPLALKRYQPSRISFPTQLVQRVLLGLTATMVLVLGLRAVAASIAYRNTVGETSLGKAPLAAHYGSRLIGLSPFNPKAWAADGAALAAGNQYDQALEAYQRSVDLDPYAVENLVAMADIRVKQGKFQEALDLSQKAEALVPNYAGPAWTSAVSLFELKKVADSAREFEKYLVYLPNDYQAWLDLGVCYIQLGRKADAVESWGKAHQFNPTDPQAIAYLKSQGVNVP